MQRFTTGKASVMANRIGKSRMHQNYLLRRPASGIIFTQVPALASTTGEYNERILTKEY